MHKFGSLQFIKFFYTHCVKKYLSTIFFISFASAYWALDCQYRQYVIKEILERFDSFPASSILISMLPLIYIYFVCMVARFGVLRFSSYSRLCYTPLFKIDVMRYFLNVIISKSNILVKKDLGVISNQIQEILKNLEMIIETIFINFIAHLLLLASSLLIFYHKNLFLFYGLLSLFIAFSIVSYIGYIYSVKLNAQVVAFDMKLFSKFNDVFSNLFNVRMAGNYQYEQDNLTPSFSEFQTKSVYKDYWSFIINCFLSVLFVFYHCFCLFFLIWEYQNGFLSKADFPYVFNMNREITEALWYISDDFTRLAESVGKTKELIEKVLSDTNLIESHLDPFELDSFDIHFKNINFAYPTSNSLIFENLSLSIKSGDRVGIVGYSGSGKSSLASLLLNLCPLKSGSITIGNHDLDTFDSDYLNSLITIMNQDLCLFNRSIFDNISYSNLNASKEEIIEAAKMANINEFIESLPNQYNTILEFHGKEFSYGQKQRILIARAFLRNTPILVLDEITASLDSKSESTIMHSLNKLMQDKTVIVIAHKMKTLKNMDYIITMNQGAIVEVGSHDSLLEKKGLYFELFNHS